MNKKLIILFQFICLFLPLAQSNIMAETSLALSKLKACPDKPNCISTAENHLKPLPYLGDLDSLTPMIHNALESLGNYKIITETNNYYHIEFTSKIFRFTDDLELVILEKERLIHCRSASRVGYSDMGANRKRVTRLFDAINAQVQDAK